MGFPRASRVEEVQKMQIRKFLEEDFLEGKSKNAEYKYIKECFAPTHPARTRLSIPRRCEENYTATGMAPRNKNAVYSV
jgi:hypothetical protein